MSEREPERIESEIPPDLDDETKRIVVVYSQIKADVDRIFKGKSPEEIEENIELKVNLLEKKLGQPKNSNYTAKS